MIGPVRFGPSDGNAVDCYIIGFVLSSLQQSIDALEAGSDTGVGGFFWEPLRGESGASETNVTGRTPRRTTPQEAAPSTGTHEHRCHSTFAGQPGRSWAAHS